MHDLHALCECFLSVNTRIRDPRTRDHYHRSLRQFGDFLGRPPLLDDLNDDAVSGFMLWTVRGGLTEVTANQRAKQLLALWDWLARRRYLEAFPTVQRMVEPEPMPVAWKADELPKLFAGCEAQKGWIGPHKASIWWLTLHWWLWDTGERTWATLHLERDWVDLANGVARIPGRFRKGGRKSMTYRLRTTTIRLLGEMLALPTDTGLVFDKPWKDDQSFYNRYRKVIGAAGLRWVPRKTGLKKMRITVFTAIEARGGNATAFARHSSRRVTEAYIDQAILAACGNGVWPDDGVRPDSPKRGILSRLFGRAG